MRGRGAGTPPESGASCTLMRLAQNVEAVHAFFWFAEGAKGGMSPIGRRKDGPSPRPSPHPMGRGGRAADSGVGCRLLTPALAPSSVRGRPGYGEFEIVKGGADAARIQQERGAD